MVMDCNKWWLQEVIYFNVLVIVFCDLIVEIFVLVVNSAVMGMMFLFGDWWMMLEKDIKDFKLLSVCQWEILIMLAVGELNKEIGRVLNISIGMVKVYLEFLYCCLEVKNCIQVVMMLNIFF